jgi:streptogramin lyase
MNASYRLSTVAFTIIALAACAGQSTSSTLPGTGNAAAHTAAASLQFTVYTAGQTPGFPITAGAFDIAAGAKQSKMWFTDPGTPAIGTVTTTGTFTEYTSGLQPNAKPYAIVAAADGNMWFSDYNGLTIGKVRKDGTITEYTNDKLTDTSAKGIAITPDGTPWVIGYGVPSVLAHLTHDHSISFEPFAEDFTPDGTLASDADGNLWFTGQDKSQHAELLERVASTKKIVHIKTHLERQFLPCCPNQAANPMVIGSNGAPWFTTTNYLEPGSTSFFLGTEQSGKVELFRLTHAGLSSSAYPSGIASTGTALWISGGNPLQNKGALWHFTAKGDQKAYAIPYDPISLTVDNAGNPWFTAAFSGSAAQIVQVEGAGSH